MTDFIPLMKGEPKTINVSSAWQTIPPVLVDIINTFHIKTNLALEFGVERGFSTSALANYFKKVIGVDTFDWIFNDGNSRTLETVQEILKDYQNIHLVKGKFQDFIAKEISGRYDLIHVDIGYESHEYETTYPCGDWALQHSDCVIFHDTLSFPGVMKACEELAAKHNFEFYNYREPLGPAGMVCGLGILIKK